MNLTPEERRKLLAAAEIVDKGDLAVVKKIIEFGEKVEELEKKVEEVSASAASVVREKVQEVNDAVSDAIVRIEQKAETLSDGEDYVITEQDKKDMARMAAKMVKPQIVEKVIERTEVVREVPTITNEIVKEVLKESSETGETIVGKINSSESLIDKERVRGLNDDLKRLSQRVDAKQVPMRGMRKIPIVRVEDLTSQVDGIATSFVLPKDTTRVHAVWSTQFPVTFSSSDFSLSGQSLSLGSRVIESGQTLMVLIETLFYA